MAIRKPKNMKRMITVFVYIITLTERMKRFTALKKFAKHNPIDSLSRLTYAMASTFYVCVPGFAPKLTKKSYAKY